MSNSKTLIVTCFAGAALVAGLVTATAVARDGHGWRSGHGYDRGHHRGQRKMRRLRRADADGNGEITLQEVEAMRAKRFAKLDTDGDGTITQSELTERAKARAMERIERRMTRKMRRLDADRDGKVTPDEFTRFAKERFTWSDFNDDGKLTSDELPGHHRRGGKRAN